MAVLTVGHVTAETAALRDAMRAYWCQFLRGAAPWMRCDGKAIMEFGHGASPAQIDRAEYALWGNA